MGLRKRVGDAVRVLTGRRARTGSDDEPEYRCIKCGEGYDRARHSCSVCGAPFVAPTNPGGDDADDAD